MFYNSSFSYYVMLTRINSIKAYIKYINNKIYKYCPLKGDFLVRIFVNFCIKFITYDFRTLIKYINY